MDERAGAETPVHQDGWEDHEKARRLRVARLSLIDKLQWLEEAHRVARHLEASRRARRPSEGKQNRG